MGQPVVPLARMMKVHFEQVMQALRESMKPFIMSCAKPS
jgi:hypothetical protein